MIRKILLTIGQSLDSMPGSKVAQINRFMSTDTEPKFVGHTHAQNH